MIAPVMIAPGDAFPIETLQRLDHLGNPVALPAAGRLLHVQMRRFAGCPICDLHLRGVLQAIDRLGAAGIDEVAVFHSTLGELREYESDLGLTAVADPDKQLYSALGMQPSINAYVHLGLLPTLPAVAGQIVRGMHAGHGPLRIGPTGGELGRPADVLIDHDGVVVAAHYGAHAADQSSVDEILARAAQHA